MKYLLPLALILSAIAPATAQAPGVSIFDQSRNKLRAEEKVIGKEVETLLAEGENLSLEDTQKLLKKPSPQPITLPPTKQETLSPTEIARLAQKSSYRIGYAYLCNHCDNWHVSLAGGYAITSDGVIATCSHVIETDFTKMREGALIAVDHNGKVFLVTSILANDKKIDGAIVKIQAETSPLPLNDLVSPGDAAFCFSRPLNQGDYFSEGIVNRFFWNSSDRGQDPKSLKAMRALKLNVSTRWAPGSSGSAVLDTYGNSIGHVALINNMSSTKKRKDDQENKTLITLHTATPARAILSLTKQKK